MIQGKNDLNVTKKYSFRFLNIQQRIALEHMYKIHCSVILFNYICANIFGAKLNIYQSEIIE